MLTSTELENHTRTHWCFLLWPLWVFSEKFFGLGKQAGLDISLGAPAPVGLAGLECGQKAGVRLPGRECGASLWCFSVQPGKGRGWAHPSAAHSCLLFPCFPPMLEGSARPVRSQL